MKSTISSKGQITVPVELRVALGLRAGSAVLFEARPGGAFLRKGREAGAQHPVDRLFGSLSLGAPVDALVDEMRGARPKLAPRRRRR